MDEYESLSHSKWECKYHVVFIPKCRRKVLYGEIRKNLGEVIRRLAERKECKVEQGHLCPDHVHMMISIPPKYAVAQVVGYIKGKSAIYVARTFGERKRNFVGQHFWARGYFVSTVGRDEEAIREYIRTRKTKTGGWTTRARRSPAAARMLVFVQGTERRASGAGARGGEGRAATRIASRAAPVEHGNRVGVLFRWRRRGRRSIP